MRGSHRIIVGDVREVLRTLPDESVQCCVTSPPYWGLRDYGTAKWEGGDAACDHIEPSGSIKFPGRDTTAHDKRQFAGKCRKCGARRIDSQLGIERTPQEYVENMVAVFREVRRVLRDDGVLWLNLGDSYAANRGYQVPDSKHTDVGNNAGASVPPGLKPKDLCGIPWRVAFALQADGWWLRQDVIWHKPNPMPESVRDRCTKAHEYIFLLTKSERYYYDAKAVEEKAVTGAWDAMPPIGWLKHAAAPFNDTASGNTPASDGTRNRRSVWTITTKPFKEAHFATFPPELPRLCIAAGSRPGDTILDPFNGSGTTGLVAVQNGRDYIGVELNPEYAAMAERRIAAGTRPATARIDRAEPAPLFGT